MSVRLNTEFEPRHGQRTPLSANVARVTANNPGVFTFHGTNTYIVGTRTLGIIDPGPAQPEHLSALLKAIGGRPVSHIFVTHTHRDHSDLVPLLVEATGAKTVAEGRHRPARALYQGEVNPLDASSDTAFIPDIQIKDGERIGGDNWEIEAVVTPGHAANHVCLLLLEDGLLFTGDHVLNGSTTVIDPPDGNMADYMRSLDRLAEACSSHGVQYILPAHGHVMEDALGAIAHLKAHRLKREAKIEAVMLSNPLGNLDEWLPLAYDDVDPRIWPVAKRSLLAHVERIDALNSQENQKNQVSRP